MADFRYDCLIVHDACAPQNLQFNGQTVAERKHIASLEALNGTYGRMVTADGIIAEIQ